MTTNVNILTEEEWRMIHNALAAAQSTVHWLAPERERRRRQQYQQLMDKVRDNYIKPI